MAEKFYSILTNIGKAKIANSIGLGSKVNFVTMKVGDGGGAYYEPTEDQTDLKNTVWQGNINHVEIDEDNPNWIHIEVMIPSDAGGFTIREYGAFDEEGNMLGICKCAETYKPVIADGSTKELLLNLILAVSNTESITLKIDPTIIFAKKSDVEQLRSDITTQLSDLTYQVAGGTATAITLTMQSLVNGYAKTFIAGASNNGAATTINGKPIYKPNTTTAPNLIAGKAYTIWYNSSKDCFFIKASAEGNTIAAHVLAGDTFSNDSDTGLIGSMPNNGALNSNLNCGGTFKVPAGYTTGGTITANSLASQTSATADQTKILNGYSAWVNGNLINGNATIQSLGGVILKSASGTVVLSSIGGFTLPSVPFTITGWYAQVDTQATGVWKVFGCLRISSTEEVYFADGGGTDDCYIRNISNYINLNISANKNINWIAFGY
ncbi:phage tail protein [uncultured Clostridium sp.]|uniref:phage tail-collar fiber domain-containing protein n=1 Tax=uncultured Clostridium sp. TaxID=59620 RepID=UPI0028E78003|nr:phage tail protein [uncultured Clostridium sp.]